MAAFRGLSVHSSLGCSAESSDLCVTRQAIAAKAVVMVQSSDGAQTMAPLMRRYALPIAHCLLLQATILGSGVLWLGWPSPWVTTHQASLRD